MHIILDLIIVAIIILCMVLFAKKGFVKTIIGFVGMILALLISVTLSTPLSNLTYNNIVEPAVTKALDATIDNVVDNTEVALKEDIFEALPDYVKNRIDISELNLSAGENTAAAISEQVVMPLAISFLNTIFTLILFIILSIAVSFLAKFLNKIFSFSFIGKANRILGGVLGIVEGIIFAVIFVVATNILISLTGGFFIFTETAVASSRLFGLISQILPSSFLI